MHHSPVPRCRCTAEQIAAGFKTAGGRLGELTSSPAAGGRYVIDSTRVFRHANDLGHGFVRAWFEGKLPPSIIKSRDETAADLLEFLHAVLRSAAPDSLTVVVTHDWNILAVRESFFGVRHEDVGWADFLDGPVFALEAGSLTGEWRGNRFP